MIHYSVSIDVSEFMADINKSIKCTIEKEDRKLYNVKENGRDQVSISSKDSKEKEE